MSAPTHRRFDDAGPTKVRRYDVGGRLRAVHRKKDGSILAEGIAVREGILEYQRADGSIRRELVTREALLDTARTLGRAPMTLGHPKKDGGFVRSDNAQDLITGDVDGETVVEEDAQGGFVRVKVAIRRKDAVEAFDRGIRDLSCGYEVGLDETPGVHPKYGRYDARQVSRDGNHLAQVKAGRSSGSFLRADSDDAVAVGGWTLPQPPAAPRRTDREDRMDPKLAALLTKIGVQRLDTEGAALDEALALINARSDAKSYSEDEFEAAKKESYDKGFEAGKKDMEGEAEKEKGRADALQTQVDQYTADEKTRADAKLLEELQADAKALGIKHDGLDLAGLRNALAASRGLDLEGRSDSEIDGILAVARADAATKRAAAAQPDPKRMDISDGSGPESRRDANDNYVSRADQAFLAARGLGGAQ